MNMTVFPGADPFNFCHEVNSTPRAKAVNRNKPRPGIAGNGAQPSSAASLSNSVTSDSIAPSWDPSVQFRPRRNVTFVGQQTTFKKSVTLAEQREALDNFMGISPNQALCGTCGQSVLIVEMERHEKV